MMEPPKPLHALHSPLEHAALKWVGRGAMASAALALVPGAVQLFASPGSLAVGAAKNAVISCGAGAAHGWAGSVAGLWAQIPWIGGTIAVGGLASVAIAATIGIGGMWLGNYIDKHTEKGQFHWGAVVRWASLATSVLVSLPALLPAIAMGIAFFGYYANSAPVISASLVIGGLGASGGMSGLGSAASGAGLAALHAITCALPFGVAGLFAGADAPKPQPKLHLPLLAQGRLQQSPHTVFHAA